MLSNNSEVSFNDPKFFTTPKFVLDVWKYKIPCTEGKATTQWAHYPNFRETSGYWK